MLYENGRATEVHGAASITLPHLTTIELPNISCNLAKRSSYWGLRLFFAKGTEYLTVSRLEVDLRTMAY